MSEPAPVPAPSAPETAAPAAPIPPAVAPQITAQAVVRVTPAWWVPLHAFAVLAARLAYPLALLGVAGWLVSLVIKAQVSGWFVIPVLIVVGILIAAAPKDPEA